MNYSYDVCLNEEGIQEVRKYTEFLSQDGFIQGITMNCVSERSILSLHEMMCQANHRFERELDDLDELRRDFINDFATGYNGRFSTADHLFRKLHSSMKTNEKLFRKFRQKSSRRTDGTGRKRNGYKNSYLSRNNYTLDAFGLRSCPYTVQDLYYELERFFYQLHTAMQLCQDILDQEQRTMNDDVELKRIYNDQVQRQRIELKEIIASFVFANASMLSNPLSKSWEECSDKNKWLRENYHKHDIATFNIHVLYMEYLEKTDITPEEKKLFGSEAMRVKEARDNVESFFAFIGKRRTKGKKINAIEICMLCRFCHCNNMSGFYAYVEKRNTNAYAMPAANTVSNNASKVDEEKYKEFERWMTQAIVNYHNSHRHAS